MSIRLTPSASSARPQDYASFEETVSVSNDTGFNTKECCFCFPNCDWQMPAFANLSDQNNRFQNDKRDFIFNVPTNGTVEARLIELNPDNTEKQSILITDSTYGDLFNTGTVKANVWGFILDWYRVASVENFGRWKMNFIIKLGSGVEIFNEDSACYRLEPWSCRASHRTVKIRTRQSGYFEDGFDYSGISFLIPLAGGIGQENATYWPQEVRLYGRFSRQGREYERDEIQTQDRGQQLVQSQTIKRYLMQLDTIPTSQSNRLIDDMLQAPEVYVTDQNINNIEVYQDVRVTLTDIPDPINYTMNENEFQDLVFLDWKQGNIHRFK